MKIWGWQTRNLAFFTLSIVLILSFSSNAEELPDVLPEAARNYVEFGVVPNFACSRLDTGDSVDSEVRVGGGIKCSSYLTSGLPSSQEEDSICSIANNPSNTSNIRSAAWLFTENFESPFQDTGKVLGSAAITYLGLFVCEDGSYTLKGPFSTNQDSPCDCRREPGEPEAVPTIGQWGFIVFGILLAGSAVWFIKKRRQTS